MFFTNEVFTNLTKENFIGFSDDGIVCKAENQGFALFYPYGSITKISFNFGSFLVAGRMNGTIVASTFIPSMTGDKKRIKEMIAFAKDKMKNAEPGEVVKVN